jgi:hypothetical protein
MPQPVPAHIPTAAETDCHLATNISRDGTCTVIDKTSGQKVQIRLGVLAVGGSNQLTLVAVGPGSG